MMYDPRAHGAKCDECPLQGSTVVPPECGASDLEVLSGRVVAVIGEAPGEQEERQHRPFVGPSGDELNKALAKASLRRRNVHVSNVLHCRPPGNKLKDLLTRINRYNKQQVKEHAAKVKAAEKAGEPPPTGKPDFIPSPIDCCAPRFEAEIAPFRNFITLGKTATHAVTGIGGSILALRGGLTELEATDRTPARQVMPTIHPAFCLRMPRWFHVFRNDVYKAARWFRGEAAWVPPKTTYNPDAETLRQFLSRDAIFTFDIETDGIECLTANIRCIAIGDENEVMVMGFLGRDGFTKFYSHPEELSVRELLCEFFEDETKMKAGHNAGYYDKIVLQQQWGIDPKPIIDTILLHRCVESELPHGLAYVASMYTEAPSWKCYDPETEVLTRQGWTRFPQLEKGVEVAQWSEGKVSFVRPRAYVDQPYSGKMWKLTSQAADLLVTPDHKMVYQPHHNPSTCRPEHKSPLMACAVQDLPKTGKLPHVGVKAHGQQPQEPEEYFQFLVATQAGGSWVQTEGAESPRAIDFGFTEQRKIDRLRRILNALDAKYFIVKIGTVNPCTRIWVDDSDLVSSAFRVLGPEKQFGAWLLDLSLASRVMFLDELPLWDETKGEHTNWVQAVAAISGRASQKWSKLEGLKREEVDYDGRVYCVSVPSGFILVRRNGKVTVSGNSDREGNKLALGGESDQQLHEYCANDVTITARVMSPLVDQVRLRDQLDVWKIDQKIQAVCSDMHTAGMYVDQKARLDKEKELLARRHSLLNEIRDRLDRPSFNPGSVFQVRDVLFSEWELQPPLEDKDRFTSSGDPSTADLVLRSLLTDRGVPSEQRDIIKLLRYYRKVQKVIGTYVVKLRPWNMAADLGWDEDDDWVDKETRDRYGEIKRGIVDPRTGRMHPGYNAHVAVTGRLSSSKPINAQNFPKALRAMVVAAPGNILVGADMDQLELRIAAARWEVKLYLQAFAEGKDPHSMTAFAVFGERFCTAAGIDPKQFSRPGKFVGSAYVNGKFEGSGEAKKMRDLSKAVQYASIDRAERICVLDERRTIRICEAKSGDWTWAWSTERKRYEPARVKNAWQHGTKECIRVTFEWNAPKNGGVQTASVVVTSDHPMLLRTGELRHAGSLKPGDRLMPFRRSDGRYSDLAPFNDDRRVGEHRVVKGLYKIGERLTHVHHKDENPLNNHPDNLEVKDHLSHYNEHKDSISAGRVNSRTWRVAVSDSETRSAAAKKAWEGRRERKDTDNTFGPRGSVLDAFAALVGKLKDTEVAERAGCSAALVGQYRKKRGIAPPPGQQGWLRWLLTNDVLWRRLLHDNTDTEMAKLVKERFGVEVTRRAVSKNRKHLGVPAVKKTRREVYPRRVSKLDSWADRIGHEKDTAIAAEAGCSKQAVAYYRKTRGIPAYWREAPGGTNHKVVSIARVGLREVWDIEVEHEDHNFPLAAGIFVHNSQYMATVETVQQLICKTEVPARNDKGEVAKDGTTDLPYALLPLRRVRQMRENWLKGAPEFEAGWETEIQAYRNHGFLKEDVTGRRRDFLDGEMPNEIVNFPIQCVPGHIRVLTKQGYVPIRELVGRRFQAWTGKRWASATCIPKGTEKLQRVKTNHVVSLLCGASHKFKVPQRSAYEWTRADSLKVGQRVALDLARPLEFGQEMDRDDAYLLGLWLADGSVSKKTDSRGVDVCFTVGDESVSGRSERAGKAQVDRVFHLLKSRGLRPCVTPQKGCSAVGFSAGAREWCESWGLPFNSNAHSKRVPECVWRSSLAARKAFLVGFLDGDGYQHQETKQLNLHLCNEALLRELALLFRTVGVDALSLQGPLVPSKGKKYRSYRLNLAASHVHEQLGWGLPAKYRSNHTVPQFECARVVERLAPQTQSHKTLKSRIRGHAGGGTATPYMLQEMGVDDLYDHGQVTSSAHVSLEVPVYTLCVDDEEHCYVAEGFLAKNSSGAGLMNKAILELHEQIPLNKWGPGTGIINQCHDSIVVECPESEAPKVAQMLEEAMNQTHEALPGVTFTASAAIGRTWKEVG